MDDTRTEKQRWLDEAIDLCPEIVRPEARDYLQPLLKRCNSKSKKTFWQWLRLQCARNGYHNLLSWMQDRRCPLEITKVRDGFHYVVNGDVALIVVANETEHAVWRVPVSRLEWALSLYPVCLKRLPALESYEATQIRRLKRRLRTRMPFLTAQQRQAFEREIEGLEESRRQTYEPAPRFMLVKYEDGREKPVHRLFIDAQRNDEVEAVDGDFLNFTTAKIRVTVEPVTVDGLTIAKGNRLPSAWSEELVVPNLYVVNSDRSQKDFEDAFLQTKSTPQGDIKTTLRIQPNADLGKRTGVNGRVMDCGSFDPLTSDERVEAGLGGAEVRPTDEAAAIRRKWLAPKSAWGTRWG